jgi:L-seryl-tRNA(Ser) seleniumtransferase
MELRDLPSVDGLAASLAKEFDLPDVVVVSIVKSQVEAARDALLSAGDAPDPEAAARQRLSDIEAAKPRAVINATGVLLHTNLGRAQASQRIRPRSPGRQAMSRSTSERAADQSGTTISVHFSRR